MNLPKPFAKQFWSHDGVEKHREEIEQILGKEVDMVGIGAILSGQTSPIKQTAAGIWILTKDSHISKWVEEKGQLQHDFQTLPVVLPEIPVGGTVIDCGANIGDSAAPFLHRVGPTGEVCSFEPNLDAFECLKRNMEIYSNWYGYQVALSDRNEILPFAVEENAGASHIDKRGVNVQCITLDSLKLTKCDFIKIDCEGFELRVLKGATKTISKFRPKMLIEINESALNLQGSTPAEVLMWLTEREYQFWPVNQPNLEQAGPQYDVLCKPLNNTRVQRGEKNSATQVEHESNVPSASGADQQRRIVGERTPTVKTQTLPRTNTDEPGGVTAGETALITNSVSTGSKLVVPWADREESLGYIDWLAKEAKRFCTAPRYVTIVRERLKQAGVIKKLR